MLLYLILINLNDSAKFLRYTLFHGGLSFPGSMILDLLLISLNHIYQFETTAHLNVRKILYVIRRTLYYLGGHMAEIATIGAILTSVKTATEIAKMLKDSDLSLENAEMKLKLAELVSSLTDAKLEAVKIQ